jgi:hypothetical protein
MAWSSQRACSFPYGHIARSFSERPLRQVQATSAGRCEVNVVARVTRHPVSRLADLVRAVVVHYQMHIKAARKIGLDLIEKPQEPLLPVPAGQHVLIVT